MAELAHDRHTEDHPTDLEIMEDGFYKGWFGRVGGAFFLFERAMRLHAPDVWKEQETMDPVRWGEKYGFPILEVEQDGEKVPRWRDAISLTLVKFHHAPRFPDQKPDDYMKDLKAAFNRWAAELYKVEKEKYRAEKKRWPEMDQVHHAEWFVLNHVRGWSHNDIWNWEQETNGRELSYGAVSAGIRNFAQVLGVRLRDKPRGGRPKSQ